LQQTTIDEKASHIHAKLQPYTRRSFAANNKQQNNKASHDVGITRACDASVIRRSFAA